MSFPCFGNLQERRAQQVAELQAKFPSATAINAERSVFDLPLDLGNGRRTALRVILSPRFPEDRPVLSVQLPIQHPAVDNTGVVHTPTLDSWALGQSQLASAVAEACGLLRNSKPELGTQLRLPAQDQGQGSFNSFSSLDRRPQSGTSSSASGSPTRIGSSASAGASGQQMQQQQQQQQQQQRSLQPPSIPDLSSVSTPDLEKLLIDDAAFKQYLVKIAQSSSIAQSLAQAAQQNRALAESNLGQQNALNEALNQLAVVKSSEYSLAKQHFDELYSRHQAVVSHLGTVAFKDRLEDACSQVDTESSAVAAAFLAGDDVPTERWVQRYCELRTKYHILDLKRQAAEAVL